MAENVTISTFLELKDNMTDGLARVSAALDRINTSTGQTSAAFRAMAASQESASTSVAAALGRQREALDRVAAASAQASGGMNGFAASARGSEESLTGAITKGSLLAETILKIASVAKDAAVSFLKSSVELHSYMQTTTLNIAQSLKTFDLVPDMDVGLRAAKSTMDDIRKAAAALPGETKDYIQVFSLALPKAIEAGMSDLNKITEMTNRYAAVALGAGIDARQAGMDLYRMLAGQAGADVAMWNRLIGVIKMAPEEFNKLPAPERQKLLAQAIEQSSQGLTEMASSWQAQFGTFVDLLRQIQETGTQSMFEQINIDLQAGIAYLNQHRENILAIVELIGAGIVGGLRIAIGLVVFMERAFAGVKWVIDQIKDALTWISDKLGSLRGMISGFLSDADDLSSRMDNATDAARRYNEELDRGREAEKAHKRDMAIMEANERYAADAAMQQQQRVRENEARAAIRQQDWYTKVHESLGKPAETGAQAKPLMDKLVALQKRGALTRAQAMDVLKAHSMESFGSILSERMGADVKAQKRSGGGGGGARKPKAAKTPVKKDVYDFRYSKFDIKQEFAEGFDPDRIAVAFASDLGRLGEMKSAAVYAPLFTGG